jgi:hypothetical protein
VAVDHAADVGRRSIRGREEDPRERIWHLAERGREKIVRWVAWECFRPGVADLGNAIPVDNTEQPAKISCRRFASRDAHGGGGGMVAGGDGFGGSSGLWKKGGESASRARRGSGRGED